MTKLFIVANRPLPSVCYTMVCGVTFGQKYVLVQKLQHQCLVFGSFYDKTMHVHHTAPHLVGYDIPHDAFIWCKSNNLSIKLLGNGSDRLKFMYIYCDKLEVGNTVHVYLDLDKCVLSFDINDKKFGKAFDVPSGEYRAVISLELGESTQEIELMSYS